MTAHYLTTDAHAGLAQPGDWMLIHGVGGGTCQWAAQMAKLMGYKVIGTVAKGKEAMGRATGVDELIVLNEVRSRRSRRFILAIHVLATHLDDSYLGDSSRRFIPARHLGNDHLGGASQVPGTSYEDYESVDVVAKVMEATGGEGCKARAPSCPDLPTGCQPALSAMCAIQ